MSDLSKIYDVLKRDRIFFLLQGFIRIDMSEYQEKHEVSNYLLDIFLENVATNLHHDKLDITIYIYLEIIFCSNRQSIMNLHLFYLKKNWLICKKIHSFIFMVLLS